jgi:aldose 1-epimerase
MNAPAPAVRPSGEQIELVHGGQRAVVVEVGGALRSYTVDGDDVLDGYAAAEMCSGARGQTFVPWPNRLRDGAYHFAGSDHQLALSEPARRNAIHGLVRWQAFEALERSSASVTMTHRLHPQPGFPFALRVAIEYSLDDDGLTVRTTATNTGDGPCPYGTGAHPYLTVGTPLIDDAILRCPGACWMPGDDRAIPLGSEPVGGTRYDFRTPRRIGDVELDTGFCELARDEAGVASVELATSDARRNVALWVGPAYRYLMLFTGDTLPETARRRQGLGVEPMTCAPNAFQTGVGLQVLEPGASHVAQWGIRTEPPTRAGLHTTLSAA